MALSHRPKVKITGTRSILASSSIVLRSCDEEVSCEKNLDFLRGNFRILAGLPVPTRTVTDACEEGKSQFSHKKTLISVQEF